MGADPSGFIGAVTGANPKSPGLAGVSIDGTGKFTFDRAKFLTAFDADPSGVTKLFAQGGSSANANVQFVSAGDRAVGGDYDVNVTTAAAQGSSIGLTGAWPPATLPSVKVRVGTTEVSYAVKGGDTQDDVVKGLERRLRQRRLRAPGDQHRQRRADRDERIRRRGELRRRLERRRLPDPRRHRHPGDDQRSGRDRQRSTADGCVQRQHPQRACAHDHERRRRRPRELHVHARARATRADCDHECLRSPLWVHHVVGERLQSATSS